MSSISSCYGTSASQSISIRLPEELNSTSWALISNHFSLREQVLLGRVSKGIRALTLLNRQLDSSHPIPFEMRVYLTIENLLLDLKVARACGRKITILDLSQYWSRLTDAQLSLVTQLCPDLKELNLRWCSELTDEGLLLLADNCKKLQFLNIDSSKKFTREGFEEFGKRVLTLRSLSLSYSPIVIEEHNHIVRNWVDFCELDLSGRNRMTDKSLKEIGLAFPGLISLSLNNCRCISEMNFSLLGAEFPALRSVDLSGGESLNDANLIALANSCPLLQNVNLSRSPSISIAGVIALTEGCIELSTMSLKGCKQISDEDVANLRELFPKLTIKK